MSSKNITLAFSTIQAILNWITSEPNDPQETLQRCFELRDALDIKIAVLKNTSDSKRKMGLVRT